MSLNRLHPTPIFKPWNPLPRIPFFPRTHLSTPLTRRPMSTQHYTALILGSGQSGTPLATHLRTLSPPQTVCLVETSHIAGCCVNEGCTPTKTMVASGRVAYLARRAAQFGVAAGDGDGDVEVKVDMRKVRERKRQIVKSFRGGSEKRLQSAGVDVVMGTAAFVGAREVAVRLEAGGEKRVSAERIYINVGCRPARPGIPGLNDVDRTRVLDSTSIQELDEVPAHLVVLGGGAIGVEFGQLFRRFGARVTILQRGERLLLGKEDPELAACLEGILREDGIDILLDTSASSIEKAGDEKLPLTLRTTNAKTKATLDLHASHLLLATGRIPNTEALDLPAAGIRTSESGHVVASPTLETNVQGVYVMGDVKGGPAFTHVSYDDFRIVRDNLALRAESPDAVLKTTDTRAACIPSVVYTDPQFAHVGPKWGDLAAFASTSSSTSTSKLQLVSYAMPGSWIARGLETDETRGMMKAVVDANTGRIVSFSAIGTEAGEVMAVVQMAMLGGVRWEGLRDAVWAHPSWSESLNNLWGGERKVVEF